MTDENVPALTKPEQSQQEEKKVTEKSFLLINLLCSAASALAAIGSVFVALETTKGNDETDQIRLRAYILDSYSEIENIKVGESPKANIAFKNSGQTPAINVQVQCYLWLGEERIIPASISNDDPPSKAPIASDNEQICQTPPSKILTIEDFKKIESGQWRIYTWGSVHYEDIFKNKHRTDFGFRNQRWNYREMETDGTEKRFE